MTNLDSILKSRDITLPTKVHLVKTIVFPVVMYGCESWTIKKTEHQRISAFEVWCWRRLLRFPWTARRSNQSILKISPGCSSEVFFSSHALNSYSCFKFICPISGISSVQFSCSVMSDTLQPHESQHAGPPCPSPTHGVHSNSRSSSQ